MKPVRRAEIGDIRTGKNVGIARRHPPYETKGGQGMDGKANGSREVAQETQEQTQRQDKKRRGFDRSQHSRPRKRQTRHNNHRLGNSGDRGDKELGDAISYTAPYRCMSRNNQRILFAQRVEHVCLASETTHNPIRGAAS